MTHPRPATVGQLKETGYQPSSVKDELRRNVIGKLKAGEELFPGIVGYRDSVLPQIVNGDREKASAYPEILQFLDKPISDEVANWLKEKYFSPQFE